MLARSALTPPALPPSSICIPPFNPPPPPSVRLTRSASAQPNDQGCGALGDWSYPVPALAPGASHEVVAAVVAAKFGRPARHLRAYVDAACAIPEITEANNQASWEYDSFVNPGADLAVMDVSGALLPRWTSKLYALPNKTFSIKVAVYNRGTVAAPVGAVMAYLQDAGQGPPDCAKTPTLCPKATSQALVQPGVSNAVDVTMTGLVAPAAPGTHFMLFTVDAGTKTRTRATPHPTFKERGSAGAAPAWPAAPLAKWSGPLFGTARTAVQRCAHRRRARPNPAFNAAVHPPHARPRRSRNAADNQSPEIYENNVWPRSFEVVPKALPEFNVTLAEPMPSPVTAGTVVTVSARITNVGLKPGAPRQVAVLGSGDAAVQSMTASGATPLCGDPASAEWAKAPAQLTAKLKVGASVTVDVPGVALGQVAQGQHSAIVAADASCKTPEVSQLWDSYTYKMNWAPAAYYTA
jgi:hypothetical protein